MQENTVGEHSDHDDDIGKVPLFCTYQTLIPWLSIDGSPDPHLRGPLQPPAEHEYVGISFIILLVCIKMCFSFQNAEISVTGNSLPGSIYTILCYIHPICLPFTAPSLLASYHYSGSFEGQLDSALPSEAHSISVEYIQTFGYHHKKPGDFDSGRGTKTKTRTGAPTIRSHITEVNILYILVDTHYMQRMKFCLL